MRKLILAAGAVATLAMPTAAMANTGHATPAKDGHITSVKHNPLQCGKRGGVRLNLNVKPWHVLLCGGKLGKTGLNGVSVVGPTGPKGDTGAAGAPGQNGAQGPKGDSYLEGAYYSVAYYDVGDTNGGAIATVACKAPSDTAISGGVQTLQLGSNGIQNNVPVSSSFPGRMDWSTNTPKPGRLDGWIVQFGGNSSSTDLGSPKYVKVYALCIPGLNVPVDQTYTESAS